jgi:hypothetical protein
MADSPVTLDIQSRRHSSKWFGATIHGDRGLKITLTNLTLQISTPSAAGSASPPAVPARKQSNDELSVGLKEHRSGVLSRNVQISRRFSGQSILFAKPFSGQQETR